MPLLLLDGPALVAAGEEFAPVQAGGALAGADDGLGPFAVAADQVNMVDLCAILLDNAGKWADRQVTIAAALAAGNCQLTITDDGPGMTDDQLAIATRIGTRFDPDKPGTGLGLAMARDIAEALGTELNLSRAEKGLVASFNLMLADPASG